jgi:hypothetical protein
LWRILSKLLSKFILFANWFKNGRAIVTSLHIHGCCLQVSGGSWPCDGHHH